jgi:hypothetical protein
MTDRLRRKQATSVGQEAKLATMKIGVTVAVLCGGLLAACGSDPLECKDTPHKTAVSFVLKSKHEVGKENPEIEAAKAQAQSKWEGEVKEKFGAEWASWANTKRRGHTCGAPPGQDTWTCQAEASPCKKK